ncbi:MAG: type IV secretion system protein VirD4 [Maricaulis maris]|jgi:type IV secretion system protein VirD4
MSQQTKNPSALFNIAMVALALWGLTYVHSWRDTELFWVPMALLIMAAGAIVKLLCPFIEYLKKVAARKRAMVPSTDKGTARWARRSDFRRLRRHKRGPFWGIFAGRPLFLEYESSALTVAPAGMGKTTCIVIPDLLSIETSIIAPDYKGELAVCTADARRRMGQKVYCVNPSRAFVDRLGEPARYNPLVILVDDWDHSQPDMIADARAIALQLYPEPARATENQFFRAGSRKIMTFAMLVETIEKRHDATLSGVLSLIRDPSQFKDALYSASVSDALKGELAEMAREFLEKLENGDNRQWDSFREGALQALDVFSPSGRIAQSVSACDFRFQDLKSEKATVFVIADATRQQVYAPWMGLLMWCAITELMRCQSHTTVTLLLDEASNFKINDLPAQLTRLRGYGVRLHIILQELEDWKRIYGPEALEILLSQTEIQQFFGSSSQRTLDLLAKRLGEATIKTQNFDLGLGVQHGAKQSVGEGGRVLLDANEVSQQPGALLFVRGKPPASVGIANYSQVSPWARQVGINPFHGRKLKGRIRYWL